MARERDVHERRHDDLAALASSRFPIVSAGMRWDNRRGSDGDVYALRVRQASRDRFPGMGWVGPIWVETG